MTETSTNIPTTSAYDLRAAGEIFVETRAKGSAETHPDLFGGETAVHDEEVCEDINPRDLNHGVAQSHRCQLELKGLCEL